MNNIPDDIPEAKRDSWESPSALSSSQPSPLIWLGMSGMAIALGVGAALLWQGQSFGVGGAPSQEVSASLQQSFANLGLPFANAILPETDREGANAAAPSGNSSEENAIDGAADLLGHRAYEEAPTDSLVAIVADGSIRLRAAAAPQFQAMVAAARTDGVSLVPLSGFRSVEEQQYLFFGIKAERGLRAEDRAAVSAPPGYSEHHTGYAIDVGDASQPDTHFEQSFEATAAFEWLEENAAFYSFELSFEKGASGAVSYEPWQWRFVGDRHSLETFYGPETDSASSASSSSSSSNPAAPDSE